MTHNNNGYNKEHDKGHTNPIWHVCLEPSEAINQLDGNTKPGALINENLATFNSVIIKQKQALPEYLLRLANLCRDQGQIDLASRLYDSALSSQEELHGFVHPSLISILKEKSISMCLEGNFKQACNLERRILNICYSYKFKHCFYESTCLARLAVLSWILSDYKNALKYYRQCLNNIRRALGKSAPELLEVTADYGLLCYQAGYFDQAKASYEKAWRIAKESISLGDTKYTFIFQGLALTLCAQGNKEKAQGLCQKLCTGNTCPMDERTCSAQAMNKLALAYCRQGKTLQARKLCEQALVVQQLELGALSGQHKLAHMLTLYSRLLNRLNFLDITDRIDRYLQNFPFITTH